MINDVDTIVQAIRNKYLDEITMADISDYLDESTETKISLNIILMEAFWMLDAELGLLALLYLVSLMQMLIW